MLMAKEFARKIPDEGGADVGALLKSLRNDLRKELDLGAIDEYPIFLRFQHVETMKDRDQISSEARRSA
uniref:Uncharacterized protein n=1 Tax=Candidatus Kentrum sp. DK TaxID=2126562 RepID=A0A450TPJ7_9GAMM|nr:MAG: hypothetical protein BECKDK2373C_GA0170839_11685 [Candidatus Kentron sp. DK]VFJ69929.1 MAG: hypothetical protein BECKDK2373B_GA0170837_12595 [Candidatus Kentron sp. DK]